MSEIYWPWHYAGTRLHCRGDSFVSSINTQPLIHLFPDRLVFVRVHEGVEANIDESEHHGHHHERLDYITLTMIDILLQEIFLTIKLTQDA